MGWWLAVVGCAGGSGADGSGGLEEWFADTAEPDAAPEDLGIPEEFPQLARVDDSRGTWRPDGSGYGELPHGSVHEVDDLPLEEGTGIGATYLEDWGVYLFWFGDIDVSVGSLRPGVYQMDSFRNHFAWSLFGDVYTTEAGYDSVLEIVGNNSRAVWGTFEGHVCYPLRPGSNCFSIYDGRFSARIE